MKLSEIDGNLRDLRARLEQTREYLATHPDPRNLIREQVRILEAEIVAWTCCRRVWLRHHEKATGGEIHD